MQTSWVHANWLGTIDVVTNHSGATESNYTSLPYGDGTNATGNGYSPWQFAGLDKDYYAKADSGTNHAQFRQYGDEEGRWMSPDPYLGSYNLANPQTFNRYSYAANDPLSSSDPLGLQDQCDSELGCAGGGGPTIPADTGYLGSPCPDGGFRSLDGNCYGSGGDTTIQAPQQFVYVTGTIGCAENFFCLNYYEGVTAQPPDFANLGPPGSAPAPTGSVEAPSGGGARPDQKSCASRLAAGVQKNTGVTPTNLQYIGIIGGHANYSFDVADPANFQSILDKNMPWTWAGPLDEGHRYGIIESTHILDPLNGSYSGHTDLFNGHSILAPLHWIVDVGIGHIPGADLDLGCRPGS